MRSQIFEILQRIPNNQGENSIRVTFDSSGNWGTIKYMMDWKCDIGEINFNSLSEGVEVADQLVDLWTRKYKKS